MRVLEFGPTPLVKSVYPAETVFIGTGRNPTGLTEDEAFDFSLGRLGKVRDLLSDPSIDAVFVTRSSGRGEAGLAALFGLLSSRHITKRGVPVARVFGDRILRLYRHKPVIVHDDYDAPLVSRKAIWLWHRATAIFKRNLPIDRWQLFTRSVHTDYPTPRFRKLPYHRAIIEKVHPISAGFDLDEIPSHIPEKTTDIFFAGAVHGNSYVRESGAPELARLAENGINVDFAKERLPQSEFYRRCAQARLVWSPDGLGHECHRHYEAAACGSVPLITRPPTEQYAQYRDGETAFFYDPEAGGLTAAVERALKRRDELADMGRAARAHALAHHTDKARVDHMLSKAT